MIQSVFFDKDKYSLKKCISFLKKNNLKYSKVDETKNVYRFRQISPTKLGKGYYITKKKNGIGFVSFINKKNLQGGALPAKEISDFIHSSYQDTPDENINDWVLDKDLTTAEQKVYYNPNTGHAVVAHRGTKGITDWVNNLAYLVGAYKYTPRYSRAEDVQKKAIEKYGAKNISTLGHSQGAVPSRELGKDTKEIINVNPAYKFENPLSNEYNIRSSSDIISFLYPLKNYLYPSYSTKNDITIPTKNSFDVRGEHKGEIVGRLGDQMIGKQEEGGNFNWYKDY